MSILYKILGKPFLKKYFEEQNRPLGFDDLEFAFALEHKGQVKRYYQFPKRKEMPIKRMEQLEKFSMYMAAGLTGKNINDLLDQLQKHMVGAISAIDNKKDEKEVIDNLSTCMAVISEMRYRKDRVVPEELLYNFLAVQYVREDEKVEVFSNEIQMQKVEAFKESASANHRFFFQLAGFSEHLKVLSISEDNWKDYIEASQVQKTIMKSVLESFEYRSKLSTSKKEEEV